MNTCLFSGVKLNITNKNEHAILAALGGRIVSPQITSGEVNKICGEKFDFYLAEQFKIILRCLAPLLSHRLRNTRLQLYSRDKKLCFYKRSGIVDIEKPFIHFDKKTQVYSCFTSLKDLEKCKSELQRKGLNLSSSELEFLPIDDILFTEIIDIHPNAHISLIKCILCAFDAMLSGKGLCENERFTRSVYLAPVRNYLLELFTEEKALKASDLNKFYLGYQPDGETITQDLLHFFHVSNPPPYAHILAVSTSAAYRSLYAFWNILGLESYTVCLSDTWEGDPFSAFILSPVLGSENPSLKVSDKEINFSLGKSTIYKATFFANNVTPKPDS